MRKIFFQITLIVLLSLVPRVSSAGDAGTVFKSCFYGAALGAAAGVVTIPFSHNTKGILIGSLVGLYLGAVVGVYTITHEGDPQNPLGAAAPRLLEPEQASAALTSQRGNAQGEVTLGAVIPVLKF